MAMSRKCLRASAAARKGKAKQGSFLSYAQEGEAAGLKGDFSNPYPAGSDEGDAWDFGNEEFRI